MFEIGSKELNILFIGIGVIILLSILMFIETRFLGTNYLSRIIGKEADNNESKKKVQPFAIILLIVLVSIPIIYSIWFNK